MSTPAHAAWTPLATKLAAENSTLRAWASGDARKIKRLVAMLVRADAALAICGVPKKSPVRVNIKTCLKETVFGLLPKVAALVKERDR